MAKKTWKIGEYCKGGVLTTEVTNTKILVIGKEWDFSTGSRKSSDQSKAKEFTRLEVQIKKTDMSMALDAFDIYLNDLTSHYYAEQVLDWIKSKIDPSLINKRNPFSVF